MFKVDRLHIFYYDKSRELKKYMIIILKDFFNCFLSFLCWSVTAFYSVNIYLVSYNSDTEWRCTFILYFIVYALLFNIDCDTQFEHGKH